MGFNTSRSFFFFFFLKLQVQKNLMNILLLSKKPLFKKKYPIFLTNPTNYNGSTKTLIVNKVRALIGDP